MAPDMSVTQETVILEGHIIDSLILAKVLDTILRMGGTFDVTDMRIGITRDDPSRATIIVRANSPELLAFILQSIRPHGATLEREQDRTNKAHPSNVVLPRIA